MHNFPSLTVQLACSTNWGPNDVCCRSYATTRDYFDKSCYHFKSFIVVKLMLSLDLDICVGQECIITVKPSRGFTATWIHSETMTVLLRKWWPVRWEYINPRKRSEPLSQPSLHCLWLPCVHSVTYALILFYFFLFSNKRLQNHSIQTIHSILINHWPNAVTVALSMQSLVSPWLFTLPISAWV